jgi:methionyl-tRNA synthetase
MKPEIEYSDFEKLDLRVATITEAKAHPNADKLVVLQIKIGEETRQIVAGIKKTYSPEELINKQIIIIVNLKPVTLRGEESNGMLLATDGPILLVPDKEVDSGAPIS